MDSLVKRGDIFYADLSPVVGSEQGGTRPVLIVQNDTGNRHSPTVIAAAITSQTGKARLPTHINIAGGSVGLSKDSVILLEQIRTIDKRRLREHMGRLDDAHMAMVDDAIAVSFGLPEIRRDIFRKNFPSGRCVAPTSKKLPLRGSWPGAAETEEGRSGRERYERA